MTRPESETSHTGAGAGVVVIGRNEGARLVACLQALRAQPRPVVYVDSGSSDGSAEAARPLCDAVLALDPARPFSAARARNEGAALLHQRHPGLRHVQFLDGDCLMEPGWLDVAERALDTEPDCAVVIGHLVERHPEASVYNRLCALEWRAPAGVIQNYGALGGIMMVRLAMFEALGGFNPEVIAGEDSEFGVRVGAAGHRVRKLDAAMARHDADIHSFGQWWTRAVRAGHAIGQRAHLHARGPMRDCARERRSTWFWGLGVPVAVVAGLLPTQGWSLLLLAGYGVLGWRVFRFRRGWGDNPRDSGLYAGFNLLAKWANALGLLKFHWNHARGRFRIIEYK
jgi:GT2 family glycosyltransferase